MGRKSLNLRKVLDLQLNKEVVMQYWHVVAFFTLIVVMSACSVLEHQAAPVTDVREAEYQW